MAQTCLAKGCTGQQQGTQLRQAGLRYVAAAGKTGMGHAGLSLCEWLLLTVLADSMVRLVHGCLT